MVDLKLVMETLRSTDTRVGEWVNVVGYVEADNVKLDKEVRGGSREWRGGDIEGQDGEMARPKVQAVMLWSAGGVKLADYERAVAAKLELELSS